MSKFKVGDIVQCVLIDEHPILSQIKGIGWLEGLKFKISRISGRVYFGGYNGNGVFDIYILN